MRLTATRRWAVSGLFAGASVAVACVGDSANSSPNDAGGADVTAASDAAPDVVRDSAPDVTVDAGPACDRTKPFDPPVLVAELSKPSVSEDGLWVLPDQLSAYASIANGSGGAGGYDIFEVARSAATDPWGSFKSLNFNTSGMERGAVVTGNALELYFSRLAGNGNGYDIFVTTRAKLGDNWGAPSPSTLNSTTIQNNDTMSWISEDGLVVYLSSDRTGGVGSSDIYRSERAKVTDQFGVPVLVSGINSYASDDTAVATKDQLEIFVGSSRPGGKGSADVWHAVRQNAGAVFGQMTVVGELNSIVNEQPVWVSADGCAIHLLRSETADGSSALSYDIFRATRPK